MYSALKKDGVRLYELARRGEEVLIEPRKITVNELTLLEFSGDTFKIFVSCSKGTYIRSLCRDIGEALGTGATMTALRRNSTCGFSEDDCVSLADLTPENIADYLKSEEYAVAHLSAVSVTEKQAIRFTNGGQLDLARLKDSKLSDGELVRVKFGEKFLGIGIADLAKGQLAF